MGRIAEFMLTDEFPIKNLNYLFVPAASIAGGFTFAHLGHWLPAIGVQLMALAGLWLLVIPAVCVEKCLVGAIKRIIALVR